MTTSEPDEQGQTAPIEIPSAAAHPPAPAPSGVSADPSFRDPQASTTEFRPVEKTFSTPLEADARPVVLRPASAVEQEILFIPLAVNIGDGFKFGCGFFLAMVLAMLVGFVLIAVLFVLTGLFGFNLPITH